LSSAGSPLSVQFVEADDDGSNKAPAYPPGGENLLAEQALDPASSDLYWLVLWCGVTDPAAPDCFPTHGTPLHVRGIEVTLNEDIPPAASPSGGPLLAGGPQSGTRTLTYAASDPQSGVAKIEALLGETVVGSRDLAPMCAHDDFTACPSSDEGSLQVDTRAIPNGSHRFRLRITDAADNQQVVLAPHPVEVVNNGTITERLTAQFAGSSRSTMTVPFEQRVRIRGRLAGRTGRGIGRARIEVFERTSRPGARQRAVASIRTRSDGSFSYLLAKGRPSRAVLLAFHPARVGPSASRTLHLRVRAASSLRASLRGTVVRFGGRVVSGPLPSNGKRVLLQGRAPGYTWATFATERTNRVGRFSGRYRLPVRRPGVRLQIRVVVPAEKSYPYASSRGRPITLRVR